jgi:hypothetical protein
VKLTKVQEAVLEELSDDNLEQECRSRGIWLEESECDDRPDCECDEFRPECVVIFDAFYAGKDALAIELTKALVGQVTGRYL